MMPNNKEVAPFTNTKRPHSSEKEDTTTDEDVVKTTPRKPREKKIKERTSPPTTDTEQQNRKEVFIKPEKGHINNKVQVKPSANKVMQDIEKSTEEVTFDFKNDPIEVQFKVPDPNNNEDSALNKRDDDDQKNDDDEKLSEDNKLNKIEVEDKDNETEEEKEAKRLEEVRKTYERNVKMLNEEIKEINKYWAEVEGTDISLKQKETKKNPFMYDFLGEEVDKDEADALEALSLYWLNNVARKAARPKSNIIREEDKAFYNKYCNGTKELCVETAMRLMSLPHVVTVTLKSIPKIEVVVSDVALALQDSPELHSDDFEVTEAMGMHLF